MADLIDRAALFANCYILEADYDDGIEPRRAYAISIESVRNAPTVDAVEVVHGRWIEDPCGWHCSECGADGRDGWKFCKDCGAHMIGGTL